MNESANVFIVLAISIASLTPDKDENKNIFEAIFTMRLMAIAGPAPKQTQRSSIAGIILIPPYMPQRLET